MIKEWKVLSSYDIAMETRGWINKIPYLRFNNNHEVRVIPPFAGATIRFNVRYKDKAVSVYLDCYNNLGCMDEPYWEIYPYKGDAFRCLLNETEKLLSAIDKELND